MYLYEMVKKEIYIYELCPNSKKITAYKKEELQKFDTTFFVAEADAYSPNKILENKSEINLQDLNINNSLINSMFMSSGIVNYDNKFHTFKKDSVNESILNNFYLGVYDNNKVVTIYKDNIKPKFKNSILDMNYYIGYGMEGSINNHKMVATYSNEKQIIHYLLITGSYELERLSSHVIMRNIISIPKSLYLFQLLNQEKISEIGDENIDNQLTLFDFSVYPISIIPLEYLDKAFKYNLINRNTNDINQKLENSQKILRKLK